MERTRGTLVLSPGAAVVDAMIRPQCEGRGAKPLNPRTSTLNTHATRPLNFQHSEYPMIRRLWSRRARRRLRRRAIGVQLPPEQAAQLNTTAWRRADGQDVRASTSPVRYRL